MATITVLYFAHLADRTGVRDERVEMTDGGTVVDLKAALKARHTKLLDALDSCRVAVNEEFAGVDTPLRDGQTVAFIPPVSGG